MFLLDALKRSVLRPRSLMLTVLMLGAAVLIWRQAREQKDATAGAVEAWLQAGARDASAPRDGPFVLGNSDPFAAEAFASWVRTSVPPEVASEAVIQVTPLGQRFFSDDGSATHRAQLTLQGHTATLEIRWEASKGTGALVGVRTDASAGDAPARGAPAP